MSDERWPTAMTMRRTPQLCSRRTKDLEDGHTANRYERLREIGRIRGETSSAATDKDDGVDGSTNPGVVVTQGLTRGLCNNHARE